MAYNPKNAKLENAVRERLRSQRHAALDYKPPRHFRIFRNILIGSVVIAMTAVLYTIYWFVVATSLKDAVTHWVAERASQGITASFKQIEISGFPIKFRVVLTEPKLQNADLQALDGPVRVDGKWMWHGGRAVAEMKPWNFNDFTVDLSGNHAVSFTSRRTLYNFSGTARKFVMAAEIFEDGWPEEFQLDVADLSMAEEKTKSVAATKSATIVSRRLTPGAARASIGAKTPTYALNAELAGVQLPKFLSLPLGHNIQELKTELRVIGGLAPSVDVQNLAKWRDRGGVIEVGLLEGTYGTLKTHATGTIALDQNLQPLAAMSAKFQGFFPAINTLKKAGYIGSGDAAMAKVVLGVLSRRIGNGRRSISLPLTLQDGQLSAGPAALMAAPAIDWGEDPPPPEEPQ